MLRPDSQPDRLRNRPPALKPVDPIYDLLTRFKTERSAGAVAESKKDATQRESIRGCSNSTSVLLLDKANP